MFQRNELETLRLQKEKLAAQSDVYRLQLLADWQRLRSPAGWLEEIRGAAGRHPVWLMALAAVAGTLTARTLRGPRVVLRRIGRLGKFASLALSAWQLFRKRGRRG